MEGLFGRDAELAELTALLDAAVEHGSAQLIEGEPGIGKSSLLGLCEKVAAERGFRVLRTAGTIPEAQFPFAGLHRLIRPVMDRADVLPAGQRQALDAALGLTEDAQPDLFRVAQATLTLVSAVAAEAPVLVTVDDLQWLDAPTLDAIGFLARRLESDPVVLLATTRPGAEPGDGLTLPRLVLGGLPRDVAQDLLVACGGRLTADVRRDILDVAAGNPLALIELPGAFRDGHAHLAAGGPALVPLTDRLERSFRIRLDILPARVRGLLLVAAIDDGGTLADVVAGAAALSGDGGPLLDAVQEAVDAGFLLVEHQQVRFRHPLVRSAVYHAAGLAAQHQAHAALSAVLPDGDRRTWHRAAAAVDHDDAVAADLAVAAERAHRRGATAVAITWLRRASQLRERADRRAEPLLRAADLALELGREDLVRELVAQATAFDPDGPQRARLVWLDEMTGPGTSGTRGRAAALLATARSMIDVAERELAARLLLAAALHCWWGDPDRGVGAEIADLAGSSADAADPLATATIALASPRLHRRLVLARVAAVDGATAAVPDVARMLGIAADAVAEPDLARRHLAAAADGFRADGRLGLLAHMRNMQGWAAFDRGDLVVAIPAAEEALRLARETRQPVWIASGALLQAAVHAIRGEGPEATALVHEGRQQVAGAALNDLTARSRTVEGIIALAEERYDDAARHLQRVLDRDDDAYHERRAVDALTFLADAAELAGRPDDARAAIDRLVERDTEDDAPSSLAIAREYAAAVLDGESAPDGTWPSLAPAGAFLRARLEFAQGRRLRRDRQVVEARRHLGAAHDAFAAHGADPWTARAARELRAAGEHNRRKSSDGWHTLTAQEMQIASMVAEGLTNREVGQRLYLSHRTVASHLYRLFPKLGVSSRAEIVRVMAAREVW